MNSLQSFHVEVQYNTKFQCGDCHSTTLENISISYNMNAKKKMSIYHLLKRKMSARFQMLGVRAKNTLGIKLMSCILASVILQNGLNMISSKLCKWIQQTSLSVVLASWEKSKYGFHCYCSTKTCTPFPLRHCGCILLTIQACMICFVGDQKATQKNSNINKSLLKI